jgi:hypothetical protein
VSALVSFPDSDWGYYVPGHDPAMIVAEFGLRADVEHGALWMRQVRASSLDWYDGSTALHNPETGRYEPVMCWIECPADEPDAEPWMGVRYA